MTRYWIMGLWRRCVLGSCRMTGLDIVCWYGLVSAKGDRKSTALISRMRKTADVRHIEGVDYLSETLAAKDLAWSEVRGTALLQATVRRTLKHLIWCELKPWCSKAPLHPSDRLRMKTFVDEDECARADYSYRSVRCRSRHQRHWTLRPERRGSLNAEPKS